MSLKGYILDSNGQISLKLCVAMGKWLISVKNSKNSLIFANFGCFGMFRVKKTTFPLSEMAQKGQFSGSHPYGSGAKMTSNFAQDHQGACCYGTLKKKKKKKKRSLGPKSHKCQFLTYMYFLKGSCIQSDNFSKKHNFAHLGAHVFWKAFMLYFKLL